MTHKQTYTKRGFGFLVAGLAMLWSATAVATVVVDIPASTSWQQAITAGNIVPSANGDNLTQAALEFYVPQNVPLEVVGATLTPGVNGVSDGQTTIDNTLVMSWDLPTSNALAIAWWDYRFSTPLNMETGSSKIHFSVYPPPGVWDLSLELIDSNGRSRGWFRFGPANVWDTFWISPNLGLQNPFSFYWSDPLFDITQVVAVRFDESGMVSQPFPINPTGAGPAWNAWNSLRIEVPEPTTLALMGLSLAVLGGATRRRRGTF
ncbi:MAG TPA: hypothetical protein DHV85_14155 [Candidatus Accumulibacter sp.]|nr:hypothetical protein [Accumulibacter sp.]